MAHLALFVRALSRGGAERVLVGLAGAFAERGHRVDMVLGRRGGPLLKELSEAVRPVFLDAEAPRLAAAALARFPEARPLLRQVLLRNRPREIGCLRPLARYLERERPRALLSTLDYGSLVALWAGRRAGGETRQVVREANTLSSESTRTGKRTKQLLPTLVARCYPHADAIVAVSDSVAADLAETAGLAPERIRTIHSPVSLGEIERRAAEPPDHEWFAPGQPPVVLGMGRLRPQKDFESLIRAFARVRKSHEARLVVLGQGPERARLEALAVELGIAEHVLLPGHVANPYAHLARAAVFVLSSAWEGLSIVLLEALATGCPVVSTDSPGGSAEVLEAGRLGPLVPVGDVEALAAAIRRTLDDPTPSEALRRRAADFSLERVAEHYLEVLLG